MPRNESNGAERRLAAVVSADVVGYSARMARDDAATVRTLQSHRETVSGRVRQHHGRVVDAVGDNMLAEFASAVDAVNCALDIQAAIGARNEASPEAERMPIRMGVHIGDLLVDGEQIFGDGINIAARLESLAPAGGVCVSGAVLEQVRGKVAAGFEDLGERQLKNIPYPVHVWRVEPDGAEAATGDMSVAGFGGRAAIAVLPFSSRASDPEQETIADGIVEDVIARLSMYRLFPVIARSSTFSYKDREVDARQVGADLGARYVVSGSLRRAGNRVRVSTELVDGKSGQQIQSARFERAIGDLFELQDEIVADVIGTLEPALMHEEGRRVAQRPTESLSAWESLQKGNSLMAVGDPKRSAEAEPLLRRAIELDPGFAEPHAALAQLLWARVYFGWVERDERLLNEARRLGRRALALDPQNPRAHEAMGWMYWFEGKGDAAVRELERAVQLNPSFASAWWGLASALADEHPDEAMALAQKAVRLSPRDRAVTLALHMCAVCAFLGEHFEDAVEWERKSIAHPAGPNSYRLLAAALGHLGRIDEAKEVLEEAIRRAPHFSMKLLREGNSERLIGLLLAGWEKAGWRPPD